MFSTVGMGLEMQKTGVSAGIVGMFVVLCPIFAVIAWKVPTSRKAMLHGWQPIIVAMLIASCGGFILDIALSRFSSMAPYQPVINGIGGNLSCILASRLSTDCHKLGLSYKPTCINPLMGFFGPSANARTARILLFVVLPSQSAFMVIIHYVSGGFGDERKLTIWFAVVYLGASLLQVFLLLVITMWLVPTLWRFRVDPDNSAIPLITALGDLLGTGLLTAGFFLLSIVENP